MRARRFPKEKPERCALSSWARRHDGVPTALEPTGSGHIQTHRCLTGASMETVAVHLHCARCFAAAIAVLPDLALVGKRNVDGRAYVGRLEEEPELRPALR